MPRTIANGCIYVSAFRWRRFVKSRGPREKFAKAVGVDVKQVERWRNPRGKRVRIRKSTFIEVMDEPPIPYATWHTFIDSPLRHAAGLPADAPTETLAEGDRKIAFGRFAEAEACFDDALNITHEIGEPLVYAIVGLARCYQRRGMYDAAEFWIGEGLKLNGSQRTRFSARLHLCRAGIARARGDYDFAAHCCALARRHAASTRYTKLKIDELANTGAICRLRGELDDAAVNYSEALAAAERVGYVPAIARNYNNLALVTRMRGDLETAESLHLTSLEIASGVGHLETMANNWGNLGSLCRMLGRVDEAMAYFNRSLEAEEAMGREQQAKVDRKNIDLLTAGDPSPLKRHHLPDSGGWLPAISRKL